jgi:hypothetical protein
MTFRVESMVARASSSFPRPACLSSDSSLRISGTRVLRLAGLGLLAMSLPAGMRLAAQTEHVGNAARLQVNSRGLQTVQLDYTGTAQAVNALKGGGAKATTLASADFNADGARDVVAGYATKNGGVLTLLLGNPDAFAPTDPTLYEKAMRGTIADTFLPKAGVFAVPVSPDLLVTGDFNHDGQQDVLVASRGGSLYLLTGDGKGGLLAPQLVPLGGQARAMAVIGDGHVAVSMDGRGGAKLQILAPSPQGLIAGAAYRLPAQGDSVAWSDLGGGADLAVAAGSSVFVIYNALSANPETETVALPFQAHALVPGNFIWDRDGRTEISVLASDGSIHILQHGTLDTRPLTAADAKGRRAALRAMRRLHPDPESLGPWTVAKTMPDSGPADSTPVSPSAFNSPRMIVSPTEDLMVLNGGRSQLSILDTSGKMTKSNETVPFPSAPVAALAMPQKIDASRDLVVLTSAQPEPMLIRADADPAITVSTTADVDPQSACPQGSGITISNLTAPISLRAAVCAVNNSGAGTYTINVPAGTYQLSSNAFGGGASGSASAELQVGFVSGTNVSIVGVGTGTTIIKQTSGIDRVIEQDQLQVGGIPLTISNLTLTGGNCSFGGLDCGFSGGGLLAGAVAGDSLTLSNVVVENNTEADTADGGNQGGGVAMAGPNFTITNSTFQNNSAASGSGNEGVGGGVNFLDDVQGNLSVTNSTFSGNIAGSSSVLGQGGGLDIDLNTSGDTATITGSTFTGNEALGAGGQGGGIFASGPTTVSKSRIAGNTAAGGGSGFWEQGAIPPQSGAATLINNWWGCNLGPNMTGCDTVAASTVSGDHASVNFTPWLVLSIGASPTSINTGATSTLTAALNTNSNSVSGFNVPDGTPIAFSGTLGTPSPTETTITSGTATSTFTAGGTAGAGSGTATVDNQSVSATITIIGAPVLAVSKSHTGNFTQGSTAVWKIQVSNAATSAADATTSAQVTAVDTLPVGYTLASSSGSGWSCASSGVTVTCHISQVVAGAGGLFSALQLTVNVPANSPTSVTNNVVIYGGGSTTQTGPGNGATGSDIATVVQVPASVTINNGGGTQSAIIGAGFATALSVTVTDANSIVIPSYPVIFTAIAGGSGQSGTFSNSTGTITIPTNASGVANAGTFTANLKTGAYTVTAAAGGAAATFNLTNLGHSSTTIAALTATTATIDVFGFGFTAPSGQLAFTDTTSSNPVAAPVTLNTATATTGLTPQVTTSTGVNSLPDWTTLGDINGDGKLDLVASIFGTDSVSVQLGNGDGTFQAATTILISAGFGPAENHLVSLRGNGTLDLIVGSFHVNQIAVLLGNGNGTFQSPVFYTVGSSTNPPTSFTTGDFNDDGNLDVAVANTGNNSISILLGNGSGALTPLGAPIPVGREPEAIRAGDFNGDGFSDLAVANYRDGTVTTLLNNKNGTFTATPISVGSGPGSGPQALAIIGSGSSLQLAVANYLDNTVSVLNSNGDGTFGAQTIKPVGRGPDDISFADFNGDGVEDLVVSNYLDGSVDLLLGSSGGSYTLTGPFTIGNNPYSAAVGDLDGDGTPDLVVSNCTSNNTGVLRTGAQISVPYTGLALVPGDTLHATYTPDGASKYGTSTSAGVTAP